MSAQTIILIIIVIILLFLFLKYVYSSKTQISTFSDAKVEKQVSAGELPNPNNNSNFAYSFWIYVENWSYKYGQPKIVLLREDSNQQPTPQISLGDLENNLICSMAYYSSNNASSTPSIHQCKISNIPLQKWVCVAVSVYNRTLDMYLNGKLVRTCILPGVPLMDSTSSLRITPNGGFSGFTSNVNFYPDPINPSQAYNIYRKGYNGGGLLDFAGRYSVRLALYKDEQEQASLAI